MKIKVPQDLSNIETFEDFKKFVSQTFSQVVTVINGRIALGENIDGTIVSVVFSGANVTMAAEHKLNRIAANYIVVGRTANMTIFDGTTDNTKDATYVQASAAGTARLLVF